MSERSPDSARPGESRDESHGSNQGLFATEAALDRLGTTLASYPYDRALPSLAVILEDADVDRGLLAEDDRAAKLLHEAIVTRPLSTFLEVRQARTEVELLTLEISVLRDRLDDPTADAGELAAVSARLRAIRAAVRRLREDV